MTEPELKLKRHMEWAPQEYACDMWQVTRAGFKTEREYLVTCYELWTNEAQNLIADCSRGVSA